MTSASYLRNPWFNRWTAENLLTETEQLRAYGLGAQIPTVAIRPGSGEEVAEIVRFAAAEKLALAPVGARTKLGMNIPVRAYELAIDMSRMDEVVAYDPGDLTLSVQAGVPLRKLADVLGEHGQFLPLTVPFGQRATVGGTIAAGIDSPLRQFYGTARDYVLGMEFVTGDGRLVKSGGRVVKNVSGYDLHKLMIGSFGSLGVITKVNLRTFPAPASVRGLLACFKSAEEAVAMRHRIAQSPLRPLTIELLSPGAAEMFADALPALSSNAWMLLVTFAGSAKIIERYERELRQIAGQGDAMFLGERDSAAALGQVREFIPFALERSPATVIVKMSVLPGQLARVLDESGRIAMKQELRWAAIARGVGAIYFALLPNARDEEVRLRIGAALDGICGSVRECAGNFAVPWYPEEWREGAGPRKSQRDDLEYMRKIKLTFDPRGVFAADPIAACV